MFNLIIVIFNLHTAHPLPDVERMVQKYDDITVCQAAGEMRTAQLNQVFNQVTGFVCVKLP